jgi:DNA invertase Pin-like site-specific DNA recombinase
MSTEHQKYSTENQSEVLRRYAAQRGIELVRTYADHGKSGLRLDGRDALKCLIDDVRAGRADFSAVLVYDVSRWGRFQDADESAYYEFLCKEAGILVHYCAEQFENDGSLSATIIKNMKRAMAGEYSRELSVKVFTGQCRLIGLGFRQGGLAGYGLRRQLIDERDDMPSSSAYRSRFGSLLRAYTLVGYSPARDYDYVAVNRTLRTMHPQIVADAVEAIQRGGGALSMDAATELLTVNDEFTASIVISRCVQLLSGALRWNIRLDTGLRPDITVAIRMDATNQTALDYYLLPRLDVAGRRRLVGVEEIASRMSSIRSRQSLGGNNRLAKDSVAKLRCEGCRRHEIDAMPDQLGELPLQADELEQANRAVEFDEQVNVAILASLVPRERAEERQAGHTKDVQHRAAFAQRHEDVIAADWNVCSHGAPLIIAEIPDDRTDP